MDIIESKPEVSYFRENYPVTGFQAYVLSEDYIEERIGNLRKKCGEEFQVGEYWKVEYKSQGNNDLLMWLDHSTQNIVCINQNFLNTSVYRPFEIMKNKDKIEVLQGNKINERLYFYSIDDNKTYYVSIDVLEKPSWDFKLTPIRRIFEPMGKDPVKTNIKVESSDIKLTKPKEHPEDVEYITLEKTDGYVKSKFAEWSLQIPKPSLVTGKGVEGKFKIKFNITSKYFEGNSLRTFDNQNITYTVVVKPK
ncbi:MAG: hypothetical protein ABEK17_00090 [Candidatus Aenigmatarchaeota archaeon]